MGKKITSDIKGWEGTVVIADPLYLPQVVALRRANREAQALYGKHIYLPVKKNAKHKIGDVLVLAFSEANNDWLPAKRNNKDAFDAEIIGIEEEDGKTTLELINQDSAPLIVEGIMIQLPAVLDCIEDWNIEGRTQPTAETYPMTGTDSGYGQAVAFYTLLYSEVWALLKVIEDDNPEE